MATDADLIVQVRSALNESDAGFWEVEELEIALASAIHDVESDVPEKALVSLYSATDASSVNGLSTLTLAAVDRKLVGLKSWTSASSGIFGMPWDNVDLDYLDEVKAAEGSLSHDTTRSRLFALESNDDGNFVYRLYPTIPAGRVYQKRVLLRASTTGEMTLPTTPNLQSLAIYRTIEIAASKDSRDMELAGKYGNLYREGIDKVRKDYGDV